VMIMNGLITLLALSGLKTLLIGIASDDVVHNHIMCAYVNM
jgi:hypothetical protein